MRFLLLLCLAPIASGITESDPSESACQFKVFVSDHDQRALQSNELGERVASRVAQELELPERAYRDLDADTTSERLTTLKNSGVLQSLVRQALTKAGYTSETQQSNLIKRFGTLSEPRRDNILGTLSQHLSDQIAEERIFNRKSVTNATRSGVDFDEYTRLLEILRDRPRMEIFLRSRLRGDESAFIRQVLDMRWRDPSWRTIQNLLEINRQGGIVRETSFSDEAYRTLDSGIVHVALLEELAHRGFKSQKELTQAIEQARTSPEAVDDLAVMAATRIVYELDRKRHVLYYRGPAILSWIVFSTGYPSEAAALTTDIERVCDTSPESLIELGKSILLSDTPQARAEDLRSGGRRSVVPQRQRNLVWWNIAWWQSIPTSKREGREKMTKHLMEDLTHDLWIDDRLDSSGRRGRPRAEREPWKITALFMQHLKTRPPLGITEPEAAEPETTSQSFENRALEVGLERARAADDSSPSSSMDAPINE